MIAEPWRRFEKHVDPDATLAEAERARRAKISYRAWQRANAKKAAKARQVAKRRRDAAVRRRLARSPTQGQIDAFKRERDQEVGATIIWAAAQRGTAGIEALRRRQRKVRDDCLLCGRPLHGGGAADAGPSS